MKWARNQNNQTIMGHWPTETSIWRINNEQRTQNNYQELSGGLG